VFTEWAFAQLAATSTDRVRHSDFACQNSGIMNYLPMRVVNVPLVSIHYLEQRSSTGRIQSFTCAMSWSASPIIPSTASTNFYLGTSPHIQPL
jgi:hypothetical protein